MQRGERAACELREIGEHAVFVLRQFLQEGGTVFGAVAECRTGATEFPERFAAGFGERWRASQRDAVVFLIGNVAKRNERPAG